MVAVEPIPMEGDTVMTIEHFLHQGVGADLSALACHAAVELEGTAAGHHIALCDVASLADAISSDRQCEHKTCSAFLLDPTTTVLFSRAITDSHLANHPIMREDDLVPLAREIATRLMAIVDQARAGKVDSGEVIIMRDFCLSLSRGISDSLPSIYEDVSTF